MSVEPRPPAGHVFRVDRQRGPCWYAKYRLPDGRQVQKKLGPAWANRGRPPAGYVTKRQAEEWLRSTLDEVRRGTLPGMVCSGATFADAAAEYLRYVTEDRGRKHSTLEDYRSIIRVHLPPAFGDMALERIGVTAVEKFQSQLAHREHNGRRISPRTRNKVLIVLHGIFERARRVWSLPLNPAADIERHPQRSSGDIEVYSPEEVAGRAECAEVREGALSPNGP